MKAFSEKQITRFFSNVEKTEGCWIWTGSKNIRKYGKICFNRKNYYAHRVSLFVHKGPAKKGEGLVLHNCNNPSCVNPDHLRYGTSTDNMRDKVKAGNHHQINKTHCYKGHPLSGENLIIKKPTKKRGQVRTCKTCYVSYYKAYTQKLKETSSVQEKS